MTQKVIVFGLDGASWNMLEAIFDAGLMPVFQELSEKHGKGILESTSPPATMPAWMDFACGVDSGRHGCSGLTTPGEKIGEFSPFLGKKSNVKTFYKKLDVKGHRCILVNLPGSFPLDLKHGQGLASFVNAGSLDYYPNNLISDIPELSLYKVFPDFVSSSAGLSDPFEQYLDLERTRFRLAKKMFVKDDWDFFFYLISSYDWLFHKIDGQDFESVLQKKSVREMLTEFDNQLKWFVDNANVELRLPKKKESGTLRRASLARANNSGRNDKVRFIIMSDHGEKKFSHMFYLNSWLVDHDYLEVNEVMYKKLDDVSFPIKMAVSAIRQSGSKISIVFDLMDKFPISYSLLGQIVRSFPGIMPHMVKRNRMGDWGLEVNPKGSSAHFYGGFFVKTNMTITKTRALARELRSITLPGTKTKVFSKVIVSKDHFKGSEINSLPDLILESETCVVDPAVWSEGLFKEGKYYNHQSEGIYMEFGDKVRRTPKRIKITNIAKRILNTILE